MVNSAPLSWHIPTISAFERLDPAEVLHVVFLQRTASDERSEVVQALGKADEDVLQQLDIPEQTTVRRIVQRRWIRDYWPSSAAILTIAERAHIPYRRNGPTQDPSYSSVVFADSGWESGNVIAAHWEQSGEEWLLAAARVKIGLANLLLTACDAIEGMTMSQALGPDTYQELMIDLYKDLPTKPLVPRICFTPSVELPSHLPQGLATDTLQPILISLRSLDTETMAQLRREITEGSQDIPAPNVQIYNWEGPEPTDPLVRTSSGETPNGMAAFFVDYLHQGPNGEPRIVACIDQSHGTESNTVLVPVYTATFLEACKAAAIKVGIEQENGLVDQWQREEFEDLNVAVLGKSPVLTCKQRGLTKRLLTLL